MKEYNFSAIESKWQKYWDEHKTFEASNDFSKKKFYGLVEFPYPSGHGMHVGHIKAYSGLEVVSRKRRMQGYNVLFPIGFDAYGLPTENTAIKTGVHPRKVTDDNIKKFTGQLKRVGFSFDWSRVIDTTDENYYKWTQWIFLKMFENGLVFRDKTLVNYCPSCKVVLSNEDSQGGHCDVCHSEIVQKTKEVWYLRITEYADKLLQGLEEVDYLPNIKLQQQNWIGKSTGAFVNFKIKEQDEQLKIYTTRPDTLYGVTFMVIAPEHPIIQKYRNSIANIADLDAYKTECAKKSEFERTQLVKDKTGVKIDGLTAINPITGKEIPIYISDYVMMGYGTGAIMAVPAHDTRDYDFAKKFGIDIIEVIKGGDISKEAYTGDGEMVNSGELNGITNKKEAIEKMLTVLEKLGCGEKGVQYKMKDWAFNRQRYWGEPIPIVHCPHCGMVAVPYDELPLKLPPVENFEPGTDGESPLAKIDSFVHCKCPKCGCDAKRETDTMPQWAGSSWYFLRYCDPNNNDEFASQEALKYWMPVDWYNGGMEHTTLHLLYSRFWHKFLYDIGVVPTAEPYQKRTAHGMILGLNPHSFVNLPAEEQEKLLKEYGSQKAAEKALEEKYGEMARHPIVKMSKSLGNVINPDEVVDQYGADTMRLYEMFMGDFEQAAPWQTSAIAGCNRFLDRVWALSDKLVEGEGYRPQLETLLHQTIKKVGADIEGLKMNTAIAQLMTLVNALYDNGGATKAELETVVQLLNPFAPHMTEELWEKLGHSHNEQLAYYPWPQYEEAKCVESTVEIAVQVNGKVKARLKVAADIDAAAAIAAAKADPAVAAALEGKQVVKEIYVKGRLVNLAVK